MDEGHQRARKGPDAGDSAHWIVSVRVLATPDRKLHPPCYLQQVHCTRSNKRESESSRSVSVSGVDSDRQTDAVYRADMISHWEDGDACIHELFYTVSPLALCPSPD